MESKRKILIYVAEFPRLTETFIERDISKLIELNNLDITVFSLTKGSGELSENVQNQLVYKRISILDCIQGFIKYILLKPLKTIEILSLLAEKDGYPYLIPNFTKKDESVRKSVIGRFHRLKLVHFGKGVAYANIISKINPDEIHVHFLSESSNIAMISAMVLGIPFSVSGHAKDVLKEPSLPITKAQYAKFITVCNEHAYNYCLKIAGANKQNIHYINHGIDVKKLNTLDIASDITIEKPLELTIFMGGTRLVEKKGIKYMIDASEILNRREVVHRVDLIGPVDPYDSVNRLEEYNNLIKQKNLEGNFFIYGNGKGMPFEHILHYYKIADLFVLPAINMDDGNADGIPNTLVEAALLKVPIITTDAGSIPELIIDGETGLVVPQKDANALADAIERLNNDRGFAYRLADSAYNKAVEMFDSNVNVKKFEQLLLKSTN